MKIAAWMLLILLGVAEAWGQCPDGSCSPGFAVPQFGQFAPPQYQPQIIPTAYAGTPTAAAEHHRAVLRVGRGNGAGTGTLVWREGGKGYIVTAAHVVEGGGNCWVDWGQGQRGAHLCGAESAPDLAALYVEGLPELPTIPLASSGAECPRGGESVELCGFGGIRQWQAPPRHFAAQVLGYVARDRQDSDQITVKFTSISGDSGGPIIYQGKLVGVLWGGPTNGSEIYETHGACATRIVQCFQRWRVPCQPSPPVVVRPAEPPMKPVPPQPQPPPPAQPAPKGCDCKPGSACDCDGSGKCECDGDRVTKLEAKIVALESMLAQFATKQDITVAINALPKPQGFTAFNIDPKTGKPVGNGIVVQPGGKLGMIHQRTK